MNMLQWRLKTELHRPNSRINRFIVGKLTIVKLSTIMIVKKHYCSALVLSHPWSLSCLQEVVASHPPRLFQCSNASGRFTVEEIFDFSQEVGCAWVLWPQGAGRILVYTGVRFSQMEPGLLHAASPPNSCCVPTHTVL